MLIYLVHFNIDSVNIFINYRCVSLLHYVDTLAGNAEFLLSTPPRRVNARSALYAEF